MINYRDINGIIAIHNTNKLDDKDKIDFENQTIGALSLQLRKIIMTIVQQILNVF